MKKHLLWAAVCLALCLGLFSVGALAAGETITTPLDFSAATADISGSGYTWVQETKTLTLNGLALSVENASSVHAIVLPADTTLILEGESTVANATNGTCIQFNGSLTVQGDGVLNLRVNGTQGMGIGYKTEADSALTVTGGTVNILGPADQVDQYGSSKGINTERFSLEGGTVNIQNIDLAVTPNYWWLGPRQICISGGNLTIGSSPERPRPTSRGISCHKKGGSISITGGTVDISGTRMAIDVGGADFTMTDGTLRIHDLRRGFVASTSTVEYTYGFYGNSPKSLQLLGGDVSVFGCDYAISLIDSPSADALEIAEDLGLQGLVSMSATGIYDQNPSLGDCYVTIYGEYTLTDVLSFPGNYSHFWKVGMAPGSVLTIPETMEFDLSNLIRKDGNFGEGTQDDYDLSGGRIINYGTLVLPVSPVTTAEHIAGLNVEGNGQVVVRDHHLSTGGDATDTPLVPLTYSDGGTVIRHGWALSGQTAVSHTPAPKEGFTFGGWYQDETYTQPWDFTHDAVTAAMMLYAKWNVNIYSISASAGGGGCITPAGTTTVTYGGSQTYTVTPDTGYAIADLLVDGTSVGAVSTYTFDEVTGDHTISASFVKRQTGPAWNPFTDVRPGDWFHDSVKYMYESGLMIGTDSTLFSPEVITTRGMFATILWRLEGSPSPQKAAGFADVRAGDYFFDAVAWASEQGVVLGYSDTSFGPNDPISREQAAAMLYRYAGSPAAANHLRGFSDASAASDYAVSALSWAVERRIMQGKGDGILDPGGNAVRAEIAAMVERFTKLG